jgi:hypothetical protein
MMNFTDIPFNIFLLKYFIFLLFTYFCRKLSNYIIWAIAHTYTQELSWNYIHAVRVFWADVYQYESLYGTWYHCFWHADHSMPDALGALYANQHFNDRNKNKVF